MRNDFCNMLNDGFGCPYMEGGVEEKSPEYCLDCLVDCLEDIFADIKDLKNKVLKKLKEKDDD